MSIATLFNRANCSVSLNHIINKINLVCLSVCLSEPFCWKCDFVSCYARKLAVIFCEDSLYQCTFIICSRKYNQRPIFMQVQTYNNNKTTYLTERCSLLAELLLPILLLGIFTLNNQSINKLSNIAKKSLFQKSTKTVCFSHSYSFLNVFYMKDLFTTSLFSLCYYMKIKCNKLCKNL